MDAKELDFNTKILIKARNVLAEAMFNISYGVVPDLTQVEPGDDMYALVLHDCAEVIAMMYSKKELTIDEMVYVSMGVGHIICQEPDEKFSIPKNHWPKKLPELKVDIQH